MSLPRSKRVIPQASRRLTPVLPAALLLGRLKARQAFHVSSEHSFDGNVWRMEGIGERLD